jgi:His/Glu/Gln/Arg/opine family amino acid ABC transporter permease subunit
MTRFWDVLMQKGAYMLATLLGGLGTTVTVALGAFVFALVFGLIVAMLRVSRWRALRGLAIAYIEFIRGTPALAQLFVIYFGLPDAGITPTPLQAAIIGLGVNGAAYLAEIYRAGIEAIHKGQMEAALTLGMTPARAMQYIILPQAVRTMLPPMTTFAITLVKDTALVSVVAAPEIMFYARNLNTELYQSMIVYLIVAIIYLSMTIPMARIAGALERSKRRWQ